MMKKSIDDSDDEESIPKKFEGKIEYIIVNFFWAEVRI